MVHFTTNGATVHVAPGTQHDGRDAAMLAEAALSPQRRRKTTTVRDSEQHVEDSHNSLNKSPSKSPGTKRKAPLTSPTKQRQHQNIPKVNQVSTQLRRMQEEYHHLAQLLRNTLSFAHLPPEVQDNLRGPSPISSQHSTAESLEFSEMDVEKLLQDMNANMLWYKNYLNAPDDFEMELALQSDSFYGDLDAYMEQVANLKLKYDKCINGQPTPYVQSIPMDYWDWKKSNKKLKSSSDPFRPLSPSSNSSSARATYSDNSNEKEIKLPVSVPECLNEHFIERLVIGALLKDHQTTELQYAFKEQESKVLDLEIEFINEKISQIKTRNEKKRLVREVCEDQMEAAQEEIDVAKRRSKAFARDWRNRFSQLRDEIFDYKEKLQMLDKEAERQQVMHREYFRKAKAHYEKQLREINNMHASSETLQIYKEMLQYYLEGAEYLKHKTHEKEDQVFTLTSNINGLLYEKQNLINALAEFRDEVAESTTPVKKRPRRVRPPKGLSASSEFPSVHERNRKEMFPSVPVLKNTSAGVDSMNSSTRSITLSLPRIHGNTPKKSSAPTNQNQRVAIEFV